VATAASEPPAAPAPQATLDPEAIDSLRDEIRSAGAIPDHVIDALREELKALRRRIAVKASERVLDDQQLAQIADAVAARLAQDRTDG
jgi:non-ribosomal peptide synthetase component E (peptide arylation enzyme)